MGFIFNDSVGEKVGRLRVSTGFSPQAYTWYSGPRKPWTCL